MREKYESLSAAVLKELAKARGIKSVSAMKKSQVIEAMLEADAREAQEKQEQEKETKTDREAPQEQESQAAGEHRRVRDNRREYTRESGREYVRENRDSNNNNREYTRENSRENGTRENNREYVRENSRESGARENNREYGRENARENGARENTREYVRENNRENGRESGVRETSREYARENTREGDGREVRSDKPPMDLAQLDSGIQVSGILEVMPDGYGFIRSANYLPGDNDVYVSPSQIRRFGLKTGDIISGNTRIKAQQEKFSALLYLKTINDMTPAEASRRCNFEDMTPIFPNQRLRMEREGREIAMRIVDLISPIGKGQRGMIVSPPKAGKTTLLKETAKSILRNNPEMHLIILLIDERPEEVTDIKEAIQGTNVEVIYSTFDELPDHHKRVSEMVIERAKRLVEHKKDVTILLDSITRLARAYNLTVPPSGRTLSGGLDPAALHMPKRFFGAARNMREGGSLTILATALVDTGSKMDDVVYEEFKGTGNMELVLDRKLSERRVFPALDIQKSGTRREDLLLDQEELEATYIMRKALNGMKGDEAVENILNMFVHTRDNRELVARVRRQKYV